MARPTHPLAGRCVYPAPHTHALAQHVLHSPGAVLIGSAPIFSKALIDAGLSKSGKHVRKLREMSEKHESTRPASEKQAELESTASAGTKLDLT